MLLVIDDIWEIEEALTLKVGGPHCAYVITTRFPQIAQQFAMEGATLIEELNERDSVRLLERLAPAVVNSERNAIEELVRMVGGLPLALTLMGKYLRAQAYSGQPRRVRTALERLRDVEVRLRLSEPQALVERTVSLPQEMHLSLETVIALSEQHMNEQRQRPLRCGGWLPAGFEDERDSRANTHALEPLLFSDHKK